MTHGALPEVLFAMVQEPDRGLGVSAAWWSMALGFSDFTFPGEAVYRPDGAAGPPEVWPWRHGCPAEALEALVARGLAPEDDGRRWACRTCLASSFAGYEAPLPCPECGSATEDAAAPRSFVDLAAVASLGVDRWRLAESVANEAVGRTADGAWPRCWVALPRRLFGRHRDVGPVSREALHALSALGVVMVWRNGAPPVLAVRSL